MLTLRKLSQKIKDMNKFVTMYIQHAVGLNQSKNYGPLAVQEWTPSFQTEATCHVTPSAHSLFHQQKGTNASETGQADRRYRAVHEIFNYFYRNLFLSRNLNSVTNNSNNSYDISDYARI